MIEITVETNKREELIDITSHVSEAISRFGLSNAMVFCFVPHTTAAITINENADPDVKRDILYKLKDLIPRHDDYRHSEGNSDAHLKSSLIGFSQWVLVQNGKLVLGTWQGVYFCEFDGPRRRRLILEAVPLGSN